MKSINLRSVDATLKVVLLEVESIKILYHHNINLWFQIAVCVDPSMFREIIWPIRLWIVIVFYYEDLKALLYIYFYYFGNPCPLRAAALHLLVQGQHDSHPPFSNNISQFKLTQNIFRDTLFIQMSILIPIPFRWETWKKQVENIQRFIRTYLDTLVTCEGENH